MKLDIRDAIKEHIERGEIDRDINEDYLIRMINRVIYFKRTSRSSNNVPNYKAFIVSEATHSKIMNAFLRGKSLKQIGLSCISLMTPHPWMWEYLTMALVKA